MTKEELKTLTDKGAVITFTKADGTERKMKCTTDWKNVQLLVPEFIPPKEKEQIGEIVEKKEDINNLMVWDIESKGFRKIPINRIVEAKLA